MDTVARRDLLFERARGCRIRDQLDILRIYPKQRVELRGVTAKEPHRAYRSEIEQVANHHIVFYNSIDLGYPQPGSRQWGRCLFVLLHVHMLLSQREGREG